MGLVGSFIKLYIIILAAMLCVIALHIILSIGLNYLTKILGIKKYKLCFVPVVNIFVLVKSIWGNIVMLLFLLFSIFIALALYFDFLGNYIIIPIVIIVFVIFASFSKLYYLFSKRFLVLICISVLSCGFLIPIIVYKLRFNSMIERNANTI